MKVFAGVGRSAAKAIFLTKQVDLSIEETLIDLDKRYLFLKVICGGLKITITYIYGPNENSVVAYKN